MALSDAQKRAVRHSGGPALVLAGPGSGKTTVVTNRVRFLTEELGVDPGSILVITFTRAAAREMKERYEKMTETGRGVVSFGTFHSVFFLILKLAYRYQSSSIAGEETRRAIIRSQLALLNLETEDENELISSILGEISMVKGDQMDLEYYYAKSCSDEVFRRLYRAYEASLRKERLLDFDDMLVMCYDLFRSRPDILQAWQKKYQYILIDEFQDINRVQYEIMKMLALPDNHLFVVGDDDQSIYRFRGARPELMFQFRKDYPEAEMIHLDTNYRSSRQIVEAAGRVVSRNKSRFEKRPHSARGNGRPVEIDLWQDPAKETEAIARQLRDYRAMGIPYEEMAVLYRTNSEPGLLIQKLMEYNIPFQMRDSLPNLYDHWIARTIFSYIDAGRGDLSRSNILKLINRPVRYISRDALSSSTVNWQQVKEFYRDRDWMTERISKLESDLEMIGKLSPPAAVTYIRKAVGLEDYLKDYARDHHLDPAELTAVLDSIQESCQSFSDAEAWKKHIEAYREELKTQAADRDKRGEGVRLMTMHSSKGLEFQVVYILNANEGVMPHHKAVLEQDLEEERRMFYVAMTRAKDRLHICCVRERCGKEQNLSRFTTETGCPVKNRSDCETDG